MIAITISVISWVCYSIGWKSLINNFEKVAENDR